MPARAELLKEYLGAREWAARDTRSRDGAAKLARPQQELDRLRSRVAELEEIVSRARQQMDRDCAESDARLVVAEAALRGAAPASVRKLLTEILERLADPATPAADIAQLVEARVAATALEVADMDDVVLDARAAEIHASLPAAPEKVRGARRGAAAQ